MGMDDIKMRIVAENAADRAIKQFSSSLRTADKQVGKLGISLKAVSAAAVGAFTIQGIRKSIDYIGDAVKAASDLQETTGKFDVVFRGVEDSANSMAKEIADGYAMSKNEAMSFMASMQDMLKPMGMVSEEAAVMSADIVKLSADLGSFNNLPTADVMRDIQSAMVGNYETVRKYGTMISAASVEQGILTKGLAATKDEITPLMKAQEVYTQIVKNNSDAIGDMARTQDSFANRSKRLDADLEDLSATLGIAIIDSGAFDRILDELNPAVDQLTTYIADHKDDIGEFADNLGKMAADAVRSAPGTLSAIATEIGNIYDAISPFVSLAQNNPEMTKNGIIGALLFGKGGAALGVGMGLVKQIADSIDNAFGGSPWARFRSELEDIERLKNARGGSPGASIQDETAYLQAQAAKHNPLFSFADADDKSGGKGKGKGADPVSIWAKQLAEQKAVQAVSLQDEVAYWENILATQKMSAAQRLQVEQKLAAAKYQLSVKLAQQEKAISAEMTNEAERAALDELAMREEMAAAQLNLGEITYQEYLAVLQSFENERYNIIKTAQEERILLAEQDPDNPVNVLRAKNELLAIERNHLIQKQQLENQYIQESMRQWNDLNQSIGGGLGSAFGDWAVGLQNTMGMFDSMLRTLQQSFSQVIGDIVSQWIQGQLMMLTTKQATNAGMMASDAAAAAGTIATKTAEGATVVGVNAAEAASGAAASQASIPIAGPALAAAAFASIMALVMGATKLFSAEGGFDVPAGINPVTQLHKREMVLPEHLADNVRNMTGAGAQNINLNISAIDADGVKRLLMKEKHTINKALREVLRNGGSLNPRT